LAVPVVRRQAPAATAALLAEDVLEEVAHAQWVFVIPKMLRPYFLYHRELLGGLAHAAGEMALELVQAAADDDGLRPGMVAVVQTAGDLVALVASSRATASSSRSKDDCGSRLIGTRLKPRRGAETGTRTCSRWSPAAAGPATGSGSRCRTSTSTLPSFCSVTRCCACSRTPGCCPKSAPAAIQSAAHPTVGPCPLSPPDPAAQRTGATALCSVCLLRTPNVFDGLPSSNRPMTPSGCQRRNPALSKFSPGGNETSKVCAVRGIAMDASTVQEKRVRRASFIYWDFQGMGNRTASLGRGKM
jgi:hypothetical protein